MNSSQLSATAEPPGKFLQEGQSQREKYEQLAQTATVSQILRDTKQALQICQERGLKPEDVLPGSRLENNTLYIEGVWKTPKGEIPVSAEINGRLLGSIGPDQQLDIDEILKFDKPDSSVLKIVKFVQISVNKLNTMARPQRNSPPEEEEANVFSFRA